MSSGKADGPTQDAPVPTFSAPFLGRVPQYASAADRTRLLQIFCRGGCREVRWAELNAPYPGKQAILDAAPGTYAARCLKCGKLIDSPIDCLGRPGEFKRDSRNAAGRRPAEEGARPVFPRSSGLIDTAAAPPRTEPASALPIRPVSSAAGRDP